MNSIECKFMFCFPQKMSSGVLEMVFRLENGKIKKLFGDWRMISEILKIINPGDDVKINYNTGFDWSLEPIGGLN